MSPRSASDVVTESVLGVGTSGISGRRGIHSPSTQRSRAAAGRDGPQHFALFFFFLFFLSCLSNACDCRAILRWGVEGVEPRGVLPLFPSAHFAPPRPRRPRVNHVRPPPGFGGNPRLCPLSFHAPCPILPLVHPPSVAWGYGEAVCWNRGHGGGYLDCHVPVFPSSYLSSKHDSFLPVHCCCRAE